MEFITDFDTVMRENLGRVIATQDAVLLGRRTDDDWAAYWPTSDYEPFASFINGVEKFVVSSTAAEPTWVNTTVIDGGLAGLSFRLPAARLRVGGWSRRPSRRSGLN
jgi:hypothetical protein